MKAEIRAYQVIEKAVKASGSFGRVYDSALRMK
jgi:hypothetical protein